MSAAADQPVIPVREFFTLDLRSLALFRVALAVFILLDWVDRLPNARALFSDDGLLPRELITGIHPVSVHMLHGAAWFQVILFLVAIGFSLLLLIGWRTPWVCLISFFLLVSVHARNPAVMQGGDQLLRMLTFWSIFLPLGACWSVDASRPDARPVSPRVLSPATLAYVVQLCIVYWFAAAWKWLGPWREEGTAVYLALHVDHFPTRLAHLIRQSPALCWLLTHGTIWLETLGPVLLLLPFNVGLQRMIAIAAFVLFHAGLALSLELGHFPFVCMIAWLPLVPTRFWDRLAERLRPAEAATLALLFDPDRPVAARRLAMLRTFLFLDDAELREAPHEGGQLSRVRQRGGWLLLDAGQEREQKDALARLFALSPVWFPLERLMRGRIGGWLARRLSGPGGPRLEIAAASAPPWRPPGGLIANTVVFFCLLYVVSYNVLNFVGTRLREFHPQQAQKWLTLVPDQVFQFAATLGLDQGWGLFAPQPGRYVGWFVVVGHQKDGEQVDAYNGGPVSWDKPPYLMLTYESGRWRRLRMNLAAYTSYPYLLPGFSRYYFDEWNRRHGGQEQLRSIEIWWMREVTVPPGETPPSPQKVLLGTYSPLREPAGPVGSVVVLGRRADGTLIDVTRAGAAVAEEYPDLGTSAPIISPLYATVAGLARADAGTYVLAGFARYFLDTWNRDRPKAEQVDRVEILRVWPTSDGPAKREVLAEAKRP